ncbi:hypothetical protein DFH08DRAFT_1075367, partial [Mycena albidolilacea]
MLSVPLQLFPTMSGSNAFRFVTVFGAVLLSGVGAALDMFAVFTGCFACIPLRLPCDAPLSTRRTRTRPKKKRACFAIIVVWVRGRVYYGADCADSGAVVRLHLRDR